MYDFHNVFIMLQTFLIRKYNLIYRTLNTIPAIVSYFDKVERDNELSHECLCQVN